jgi:hypothetical protein
VLVGINAWFVMTREAGPDPEAEALHSVEDAVGVCSDAVLSQLSARNPSILGVGRTDYLQGGEYEVRLPVALRTGGRRSEAEVLCQLQFAVETGWIVEDVSVDPT